MSAPASLPEGTVTFVFTDIEGSTRLLTELREAYPRLLARHHAVIRQALASHGGTEVKTEGDAFFAVFVKAADALAFAAEAQRELHATDFPAGAEVKVRMGIHTGEGALSDADYVGLDVHRAARIAAAGHGGQVLVSDATRALAGDSMPARAALRDLGEHRLKDLPAPIRLYQLVVDGLDSDFPPLRSLGRGNLPATLTSFVGREREIADLGELLSRARLVTLTGPGGTGKTRLSIEVARKAEDGFPGGAWFIPLETITDPDLVLPAIGRGLGIKEDTSRPVLEALSDALRSRSVLLVLDNLEQVVDAAPQISSLLQAAPAPRVLCSSREALRVSGEQEYPVQPLAPDPAVELFVERARQVRPGFHPTEDERRTIADVCRALDDLPLAIELAAARLRLFPLPMLLARLNDALGTLQSGARDAPERQRTLRGAIDWSYDLLDAPEREIFARLGVFVGGAELSAIEAIIDPAGEISTDVVATVASLLDKSLVRTDDGASREPRFVMLETIRAYAAERLVGTAIERAVRDRHLVHFRDLAEALQRDFTGARALAAFERAGAEHGNLRAAIEWSLSSGQLESGLRIGGALWRFWQQRGRLGEGRALLERLLAAVTAETDADAHARALTALGGVVYWQGLPQQARRIYEQAVTLYRSAGDRPGEANALFDLAFTVAIDGEAAEARRLLDESSAIYHELGDEPGWIEVRQGMSVALMERDLVRARDIARDLVPDLRRVGLTFRLADTLSLLTTLEIQLGDAPAARDWLMQAIPIYRVIGDLSANIGVLQFGAGLLLLEGRPVDAARLAGTVQAIRDTAEHLLTPIELIGLPNPEDGARAALPAAEFEAAFNEGRALSIEKAIASLTE
ncbi:MAG TPA: tetratricopeptide repeat protein [Candidatus Limnocylindrales bacterium]